MFIIKIRDKIKIGGIIGAVHIFVAVVLSFVIVLQPNLSGRSILWNVLVFNLPVLLDFGHTFSCVPIEKIGKAFKCMLNVTVISLLVSILLSFIGIGILLSTDYSNVKNSFSYFLDCGKFLLRASILLNPIGVISDYICSVLIEEHRIETKVEVNTD